LILNQPNRTEQTSADHPVMLSEAKHLWSCLFTVGLVVIRDSSLRQNDSEWFEILIPFRLAQPR
jgi:hypothetical protein